MEVENNIHFLGVEPYNYEVRTYINYTKYSVAIALHSNKCEQAIENLNLLINKACLQKYAHSEIEIKLLLIYSYSMKNEYDKVAVLLRCVKRKLREVNVNNKYESSVILTQLLDMRLKWVLKGTKARVSARTLKAKFLAKNTGAYKMLTFLNVELI